LQALIYGKGLSALDASKKPNEYAQFMSLLNIEDEIRKIVLDRKLLGQFAVTSSLQRQARQNIKSVSHTS
jgi:hypothetical protein